MCVLNYLPSSRHWLLAAGLVLFTSLDVPRAVKAQPTNQLASVFPLNVSLQRIEGQSRRHFTERCSAFFVGFDNREAILISAWHCIDGEISFQRQPSVYVRGQWVEVTIMESGNSMDRDWLVMSAPATPFSSLTPIEISRRSVVDSESLVAIGWGRQDQPIDAQTDAVDCPVMAVDTSLALRCGLTKGDSGGVVARRLNNGELEAVGVISSGDSVATTFAFPLDRLPLRLD